MTKFKRGQCATINLPGHPTHGRLVEIVNQSKATGRVTVEFPADCPQADGSRGYVEGDRIQLDAAELRRLGADK